MKKRQRASRSVAKRTKKAAGPRKEVRKKPSRPGGKQAGPRFPVRGARGGGSGVRPRADAAPPQPSLRDDLTEVRAAVLAAMDAALDKKALAPVLIDVSAMASYTDFIGIVSGRSDRQVNAISDGICLAMKARGRYVLGQEGTGSGRWTLLDFGSFVIHVFYHPVREFYDLESLWIDAPRVKLDVPVDARLPQPDALYGAL